MVGGWNNGQSVSRRRSRKLFFAIRFSLQPHSGFLKQLPPGAANAANSSNSGQLLRRAAGPVGDANILGTWSAMHPHLVLTLTLIGSETDPDIHHCTWHSRMFWDMYMVLCKRSFDSKVYYAWDGNLSVGRGEARLQRELVKPRCFCAQSLAFQALKIANIASIND